jgi:hypothetical protein
MTAQRLAGHPGTARQGVPVYLTLDARLPRGGVALQNRRQLPTDDTGWTPEEL